MIIQDNIIIAEEGKILQNGDVSSAKVYLGKFDSPENWTERDMTEEEIAIAAQQQYEANLKIIEECKEALAATDYKAIKYAEGWITEEEYTPIKIQR